MTERNLRDIASRCEAKLHGFRRTADGVVVSFVLHPAEVPPVLALDPLGTRYMLAFVAIGDDEQPIPADGGPVGASDVAPDRGITGAISAAPCRLHKDDRNCFRKGGDYVCESCLIEAKGAVPTVLTPKARYAAMTAGEQAVQRAGMLPQDERFRAWVTERLNASPSGDSYHDDMVSETRAAEYIRHIVCGGASRARIAEDPETMDKFIALETSFLIDVGQIQEPR